MAKTKKSSAQATLIPEAPAAPNEGLTQLKVQKAGAHQLTPAQKRFNKLLAQVEKFNQQVQHIERLELEVRTPHLTRMAALHQQADQAQSEMLFFLHERLQHKGLTATQQATAREIVSSLVETLGRDKEDPEWEQLRAEYLSVPPEDAESLDDIKRAMLKDLEDTLGTKLDMGDATQFATPEEMLAAAMHHLQERHQAEQAEQAAQKAQQPLSDKQRKVQVQEQDAKTALRTIYRQLASALHPDRETDPTEHARKSALMSQANTAYERGDLSTLLRLQLQEQQLDPASIAKMADERLAALSLLLQNQIATLQQEVFQAEMRLSHELDVPVRATIKAPQLNRLLREEEQEFAALVKTLQQDLKRVRHDDAGLKRWLREQATLNQQQAQFEAEMANLHKQQFGAHFG